MVIIQLLPPAKKYMHNDLFDARLGPPFRITNRPPAEAGPRPKSTRFALNVGTRKKDHFCTQSWSFASCSYDFPMQRFWGPKNGTKKLPNFRYRFPSVCPHTFQAKWLHKLTCPLARIAFLGTTWQTDRGRFLGGSCRRRYIRGASCLLALRGKDASAPRAKCLRVASGGAVNAAW